LKARRRPPTRATPSRQTSSAEQLVAHYTHTWWLLHLRLKSGATMVGSRRKSDPQTPLRQNVSARAQLAVFKRPSSTKIFFRRRFVAKL